jgi:creatinine amidohydrolase/Fe(II)-dependent formamide hydrolase-like protein
MRATVIRLAIPLLFVAPAAATAQQPATRVLEEMTWTEIRDAIAAGNKTVIIPVGGTEQNGPHMVMGKHNYVISFAAKRMAEQLGNALVAPTVQYVPEGNYDSPNFGDKPGVLSNPSPSYENLLEAAARSLRVHGFTEILYIGDSGGNQNGMSAVAEKLNQEWAGGPTKVFALTDYYQKGQEHARAWLQAQYGYDMATIGSHAGITDTSAMLYVFPEGVRTDRLKPNGGSPDSGVRGDPTKATREIGRMVIEFKVNAALGQLAAMKAPPRGRGARGGPG